MNDDYLWDGSGKPDPEVQQLELVLGRYRYQPRPLSPALLSRLPSHRSRWLKLAAVAASVLIVLAGIWIFKLQTRTITNTSNAADGQTGTEKSNTPEVAKRVQPGPRRVATVTPVRKTPPRVHRLFATDRIPERPSIPDTYLGAERQPIIIPFIDVETARHIERAQLLLRSFRNARDAGPLPSRDVSYERQQSRGLISSNILLRRDAEAKGNIPAENLLSTLEPFLLDIANLPDKPSTHDVRSIKERMQKKEIVSALQIYSAPTLSQVF